MATKNNTDLKDLQKIDGRYISLALFRAYDKEMSAFWTDDLKPFIEQIELRCIDICHTCVIHTVSIIDRQTKD